MTLTPESLQTILEYQKNEITEHHIYSRLAGKVKSPENRKVLNDIAADELRHYHQWRKYTGRDVKPDGMKVFRYYLISRVFGLTFGLKLMEGGEKGAQENYAQLEAEISDARSITEDENQHENALLQLLDEDHLQYTGSVVLGLNDALVELTGALAGFTFALQNTKLVVMTGIITGFAAALSMATSEYLSTKAEGTGKSPLKASIYTGVAYVLTVILLILPFLFLKNRYLCIGLTLALAILIIAVFNYYISVAKSQRFKNRFLEMAGLSFGVAALSFLVGYFLRIFLGVDV